jgi:arsenical pump membrane protein
LPIRDVGRAIASGTDVYLFLAGMMLLSEIARSTGVFDWIASVAVRGSGGSAQKLFALVYGVGIVVTTVLSNDATAVVLTPAVAAAVRAAKAEPMPYLFACALIANAASFVLPISNPANLVVFASSLPSLGQWLAAFALPSLAAIAITYGVLVTMFRSDLRASVRTEVDTKGLSPAGRVAFAGIGATAIALTICSALRENLGAVTLVCAALVFLVVAAMQRKTALPILRGVSWTVLVLVAGLFVLANAAERTGLLALCVRAFQGLSGWPLPLALAGAGIVPGLLANVVNNLPAGLIAGATVAGAHASPALRSAVAIGIDLGPNLSVTGSLATILWLLALRREKIAIDAWRFLRVGAIAMPSALLVAVESLLLSFH